MFIAWSLTLMEGEKSGSAAKNRLLAPGSLLPKVGMIST